MKMVNTSYLLKALGMKKEIFAQAKCSAENVVQGNWRGGIPSHHCQRGGSSWRRPWSSQCEPEGPTAMGQLLAMTLLHFSSVLVRWRGLYLFGNIYVPVNRLLGGFLAQRVFCQEDTGFLSKGYEDVNPSSMANGSDIC